MTSTVASKVLRFGSFSDTNKRERLNLPLVSIIMPAYNAANTLASSIDSVLAQTYLNWQLIVVDDCSSDKTASIADRYEKMDNRIVFLRTQTNSGVAKARNRAIQISEGRFIAFLDSDDIWSPEKLSHQVWFLLENDLPFTYSAYSLFGESKKDYVFNPPKKLTYNVLLKTNSIGCLTAIYDTKILGKRYMTITLDRQHDYALWLSICKDVGELHGIPYPLAKYRVQQASLSSNKLAVSKSHWKVYRFVEGLNIMRSVYYQVNYMLKGYFKYKIQKKSSSLLLTDRN